MKKKDENRLVELLKKLYGKNWTFFWKGKDNGFQLTLEVFNKKYRG